MSITLQKETETTTTVIGPSLRHNNELNLPTASRQNHINNAQDTASPNGHGHD